MLLEQTAGTPTKCRFCGQPEHPGVCPMVKAIEYFNDGTLKRVEFKSASDYVQPTVFFPIAPPNPNPLIARRTIRRMCGGVSGGHEGEPWRSGG